jgi:hypothetical protein
MPNYDYLHYFDGITPQNQQTHHIIYHNNSFVNILINLAIAK